MNIQHDDWGHPRANPRPERLRGFSEIGRYRSVMDPCNFRCPYCMPKEQFHDNYRFLKINERLSFDEISRLSRLFAGVGVRKLRLTGGEPLLRSNLADLVRDLSGIPGIEDIASTTNGVLLAKHAVDLQANGLRRITVRLDTLDKAG